MHGGYRLPDWLTVVTQHQRIDDLGLDVGQWLIASYETKPTVRVQRSTGFRHSS